MGELELNPGKENNLDDQDLFSDPFSKKITLGEWNLWNFYLGISFHTTLGETFVGNKNIGFASWTP